MEIKRLTDTNDLLYEKAMALYKISFPEHELVVMSFPKMLKAEEYEHFHRYLQDVVMKDVY